MLMLKSKRWRSIIAIEEKCRQFNWCFRYMVIISIFHSLFCPTPRVALLVVDLSPSQSLPVWFAQHLQLICSLLTCLDSRDSLFQPFVLCVETSTRSAYCSVVSGGYPNTLTFVGLVLVSSCFIHPSF